MINKLAVLYSSIEVKIEPSNTVNSVNLIYCKFESPQSYIVFIHK